MPNRYHKYEFQHVTESSPSRKRFQEIFAGEIQKSKYLEQIKNYYADDYNLINSVQFYGSR